MNKLKKSLIVSLCAVTAATCLAAGCATSGEPESRVVSYVAAQSEVFNSTAEVVEAVADTVVEIQTETVTTQWGMQYIVSGAGSGVIVGNADDVYYIVTNNHVIDGAKEITVTTRAGVSYEADLIATDDAADIAVVKITSAAELSIAIWGDSDQLKIGEDLIAIGNPLGSLGGTVTKGILSATGRTITVGDYAMTLLQTDTAINPGNSGGGLFNMRGQLIGVVNAKTSDEEIEGICFAIPANTAIAVYDDLMKYGFVNGRATFNLTLAESSGSSQSSILYVTSAPDAAEGTFRQYDRIYKINGMLINSLLDYNIAMAGITAGETVEVEVYRGAVRQGFFGNSISFETTVTSFTAVAAQYGA